MNIRNKWCQRFFKVSSVWYWRQDQANVKHQLFEPPLPPIRGYPGHSIFLSVKCRKAPSCGEKIVNELPRPLNIKRSSFTKLLIFFNKWSFHRIFTYHWSQGGSEKAYYYLSDWSHTFSVLCLVSMFSVIERNPRQTPFRLSIAKRNRE